MKKFENPTVSIENIGISDVITTSGSDTGCLTFDCPVLTECYNDE